MGNEKNAKHGLNHGQGSRVGSFHRGWWIFLTKTLVTVSGFS